MKIVIFLLISVSLCLGEKAQVISTAEFIPQFTKGVRFLDETAKYVIGYDLVENSNMTYKKDFLTRVYKSIWVSSTGSFSLFNLIDFLICFLNQ